MKAMINLALVLFYIITAIEVPLRAGFLNYDKGLSLLFLPQSYAKAEISILLILALLLFPRMIKNLKNIDLQYDFNPVAVKALLCVVGVIILAHWVACGWLALRLVTEESPIVSYVKAVYWAVASLTTVGYGDIVPQTTVQYAYAIVVMLIGIAMYASIVGLIATFLSRRDHAHAEHHERLEKLRSYLHYHRVPLTLRERIWNYYNYLWSNKLGTEQFNMLSEIPEPIKTEVAVFLVGDLLKSSEIFMHASPELVCYLAPKLRLRLSMPGEIIVREGAAADEMYFISKGEVEIKKSGAFISKLKSGDHFGEMALLNEQSKRNASVIALSVVEHYALDRLSFRDALSLFPEFASQIKLTVEQRMSKKAQNS